MKILTLFFEIGAPAPRGFKCHLPSFSLLAARSVPAPCTSQGQAEEGDTGTCPAGLSLAHSSPCTCHRYGSPAGTGGAPCLLHSLADGLQLHETTVALPAQPRACWAHPAGVTYASPPPAAPIPAASAAPSARGWAHPRQLVPPTRLQLAHPHPS